MTYVLTDDNGTINLYGFSRKTLFILNGLVHDLKPITQIVPFYSPDLRSQFILYNSDTGDVRVYEHYWAPNKDKVDTFYMLMKKHFKITNPKDVAS